MVCRNGRVLKGELLDGAEASLARANMRDLARIHHWLGGSGILRKVIRELAGGVAQFSLLDVGAGAGHAGEYLRRSDSRARVTSLDLRQRHLARAPAPCVVADAFHPPFPDRSFDFVLCSLLLHQFPDAGVRRLLQKLYRLARHALVVIELQRHPLAYYFLPATRWLFGWSHLTLHDGPISVEAGFQLHELKALAQNAGLERVRVQRHAPWFRISLVAENPCRLRADC